MKLQKTIGLVVVIIYRKFLQHRLAVFGSIILLFFIITAILAPVITRHDPYETDLIKRYQIPDSDHILGTDALGRDVLTRVFYAGRISLGIAFIAVLVQIFIGVILGMVSGYFGGWLDLIIQRITEVMLAFPLLIIALLFVAFTRPGFINVTLAIGIFGWSRVCRIVRGETLSIREKEYVEAAKALGANNCRLMLNHVLPNIAAPIIVAATLNFAAAILAEASLSFLGLGVQPPLASWGLLLALAQDLHNLTNRFWLWVPPGLAITLSVLSINFIGDALRDTLDATYYENSK